ncbi:hypothetical protein EJ02DRAFT_513788 [Clathrospora elynae]|uniref:Uncharacterized protein n=1 Tax=Clathrospora elynae TaxID=706981 RepID=A0A6A5SIQ8_9PLEO|nr:hypothetical protein EJ02DRAFT_513788 [Clathrospora elynae]
MYRNTSRVEARRSLPAEGSEGVMPMRDRVMPLHTESRFFAKGSVDMRMIFTREHQMIPDLHDGDDDDVGSDRRYTVPAMARGIDLDGPRLSLPPSRVESNLARDRRHLPPCIKFFSLSQLLYPLLYAKAWSTSDVAIGALTSCQFLRQRSFGLAPSSETRHMLQLSSITFTCITPGKMRATVET